MELVRSLGLRLGRKQVGGRAALVSGAGVIGSGSCAAADHGFDGLVNLENAVDLILPGPCAASLLGVAGRRWASLGVAGRCWALLVGVGVWACCFLFALFAIATQYPALQGSAQHYPLISSQCLVLPEKWNALRPIDQVPCPPSIIIMNSL